MKDPKDNPRFVVTNLKQSPQWIYEKTYCQRGEVENRIKELFDGMQRQDQLLELFGEHVPGAADSGGAVGQG